MATNVNDFGDDETEILQFNLTNPEKLSEQLQSANLDDEETDVLLQEAMRINAQLKETLRRKQLEEDGDHKPRIGKSRSQQGKLEPLAPRNPRKSTLPPIVSKGEKNHSLVGKKSQKDSNAKSFGSNHSEVSTPKRKSSAKSRPVWDDRFSYS